MSESREKSGRKAGIVTGFATSLSGPATPSGCLIRFDWAEWNFSHCNKQLQARQQAKAG
jgi:hypothetical protein